MIDALPRRIVAACGPGVIGDSLPMGELVRAAIDRRVLQVRIFGREARLSLLEGALLAGSTYVVFAEPIPAPLAHSVVSHVGEVRHVLEALGALRHLRPLDPLEQAVVANPAELSSRRVIADQLLERGDPRGELISLQLGAGNKSRELELLAEHGKRWVREAGIIGMACEFRRGFIEYVRLPCNVVGLDLAFERNPIIEVALGNAGILRQLMELRLPPIEHLHLEDGKLHFSVLRELTAHPIAQHLRTLTMHGVSVRSLSPLYEGPWPRLERVRLHAMSVNENDIAGLSQRWGLVKS